MLYIYLYIYNLYICYICWCMMVYGNDSHPWLVIDITKDRLMGYSTGFFMGYQWQNWKLEIQPQLQGGAPQ